METYPEQAMQAKIPGKISVVEDMVGHLNQAINSLEKSVISVGETLAPVMGESVPMPTADGIKFPGSDSKLGKQLQEFCLRIDALETELNRFRARCEL